MVPGARSCALEVLFTGTNLHFANGSKPIRDHMVQLPCLLNYAIG